MLVLWRVHSFWCRWGSTRWRAWTDLQSLGWQFLGGEQVPWPSSLARGPFAWAQIATFALTGFLVLFLALPWGNATFLLAVITIFAWIAVVAVRIRAPRGTG